MNKEPWLLPYTPWKTQSDFYSYIRGGLRKAVWSRHPVKIEYLKSVRFKAPIGVNGKEVWAFKCEICGKLCRQNEIEVDHIVPAGSLKCEDDLQQFISRLSFVDFDDLRVLDKECHRCVSYAERMGITYEQAVIEKDIIAFAKKPVQEQIDVLTSLGRLPEKTTKVALKKAYSEFKRGE